MGGHKIFVAKMGGSLFLFFDADFLWIWDPPPSEENDSPLPVQNETRMYFNVAQCIYAQQNYKNKGMSF